VEGASVDIAGERFASVEAEPFVFGRSDADGVVGLDDNDMGISAVAGSVECKWGVWWVVNQSTKRALIIEHPSGPGQITLAPGHRHALTTERVRVIVPGAIFSHVLEVVLPDSYTANLKGDQGRLTSGTLAASTVDLSSRERAALAAVCAGYLEPFPRRREYPNTYEDAARLLGGSGWSAVTVRKSVERVKERFADKAGVYFSGPQANLDLAQHLVSTGILSGEDLGLLEGRAG
jgi:hypothetical protein